MLDGSWPLKDDECNDPVLVASLWVSPILMNLRRNGGFASTEACSGCGFLVATI